jgi:hypothetical protein
MSMSDDDEGNGGQAPDTDVVAGCGLGPKAKLWRLSETNVYLETLLVKAMVDCLEKDRSNTAFVLTHLIDQYHLEMRNEVHNKRPQEWKVGEYLTHSAFKSETEWKAWTHAGHLAGVATESRPDSGLALPLKRWATLKYDKWQLLKRDIFNNTHVEWVRLFPVPSGCNGKQEMKDKLKLVLFKKWMMAPTKKGGHTNYKAFAMPHDFLPFNTWDLWCEIGPGGSKKSPVFIDECCTPVEKFTPGDGTSCDKVPDDITRLNLESSKTMFESRDHARLKSQKTDAGKVVKTEFTSPRAVDIYRRNRQTQQDTIARLSLLSTSKYASADEQQKYEKELFEYVRGIQNDSELQSNTTASSTPLSRIDGSIPYDVAATTPGSQSSQSQSKVTPHVEIGDATTSLLMDISSSSKNLLHKYDDKLCTDQITPAKVFVAVADEPGVVDEVPTFSSKMGHKEYLQWLKGVYGLKEICVPSQGMCLYDAALLCIRQLKVFSGGKVAYKPEPVIDLIITDWSTVTVSVFKDTILSCMKSVLLSTFEALSSQYYKSFEEVILDEGKHFGIVDYDLRDSGKPPATFETTDHFFELMASPGAYGNVSSILAISVFCNVQIHVWTYGLDLPEIYGADSSTHYISLVKGCRCSHFDMLVCCHSSTHNFDAQSRSKVVKEEADRRDREGMAAKTAERALERKENEAQKVKDRAASAKAEENRNKKAEEDKATSEVKTAEAELVKLQSFDVDLFLVADPQPVANAITTTLVQAAAAPPSSAFLPAKSIHDDTRDFTRYHELSVKLLVWKSEYDVRAFSEKEGRGLINLVEIDRGNPIHRYGGDRVYCSIGRNARSFVHKGAHNPQKTLNGDILYRPAQVQRLFAKYPKLDRSLNPGLKFQSTHAVQLGSQHPKNWKVTICATAITIIT